MKRVFSRPRYVILSIAAGVLFLLASLWGQDVEILITLLQQGVNPITEYPVVVQLLLSALTDILPSQWLYVAVLSALFGTNISLLVFSFKFYRITKTTQVGAVGGVIGVMSAFLGIGCAACGSLFIGALASTTAGTSLIAFLPYQGLEFGFIGIILLVLSMYILVRGINKPLVCNM